MTQQVPGVYRRQVGDLVLTAIGDGTLDLPLAAMTNIAPDAASGLLTAAFRPPQPRIAVNTYLVQSAGSTVLIDTGAADRFGPSLGHMAANLRAAGVDPADIDLVLLTHIHGDHSGGLTTLAGEPVFAKARVAVAQAELDFWLDDARLEAAPEARKPSFVSAREALAPYGDRVQPLDATTLPAGITPVPLPGHTPGHTGFRVGTGADAVLVWGDVIHVPDIQAAHPEVGMVFDTDPDQAIATRRRLLDEAATDRLAIAGMHLHFPGFCHVTRQGDAYALVWDAWDVEP